MVETRDFPRWSEDGEVELSGVEERRGGFASRRTVARKHGGVELVEQRNGKSER